MSKFDLFGKLFAVIVLALGIAAAATTSFEDTAKPTCDRKNKVECSKSKKDCHKKKETCDRMNKKDCDKKTCDRKKKDCHKSKETPADSVK